MEFNSSPDPTLGVELELAVVDQDSMALASVVGDLIAACPAEHAETLKPELVRCSLELNTGICGSAEDAYDDLAEKVHVAQSLAEESGHALYWSAAHPFSLWEDQTPTPKERYDRLIELLQDEARQLVTFGLHVHVGVKTGDTAVLLCERLMRRLPLLLAMSANSPWWNGRIGGLQSHRWKIQGSLPTGGLPPLMRNWSEYVWLVTHLEQTNFVNSINDIWWAVRPHHRYGTVEVRICDLPGNLCDSIALAALIHALVVEQAGLVEQGVYQHDAHPMLVRQNLWLAERYGLDAKMIDDKTNEPRSARELATEMIDRLEPLAAELGGDAYFPDLQKLIAGKTWAQRQLDKLAETGDDRAVVRWMTEQSRLESASPATQQTGAG